MSSLKLNYNHTIYACFLGYIVQAVNNNFAPLLFLHFQSDFTLSINHIALITTINFIIQLVVDFISPYFIDRIGYRTSAILAHIFAAAGLAGLAFLPFCFANPFVGILLAVALYAIGGGVLEVLISPIVEACPGDQKEGAMSLSHSFYCWGFAGVVLFSSLFFWAFGLENWRILAILWSMLPLLNIILFAKVPIGKLMDSNESPAGLRKLLANKQFRILAIVMVLSGASEQASCQWASVFAESVLHMDKVVGDLAGPLLFAVSMGITRVFYGRHSEKLKLDKAIPLAAVLCIVSYLIISFANNAFMGFFGLALCGVAVAIFWPGTVSTAAKHIPTGGTALFAFLALAGDLGCAGGPALVGFVSEAFANNLQIGLLAATICPILLLIVFLNFKRTQHKCTASPIGKAV